MYWTNHFLSNSWIIEQCLEFVSQNVCNIYCCHLNICIYVLGSRLYIRCYNFLSNPLCILRIHMFKPKTRYIYKVKLVCIYLVSLFYGGPLNMYIVQCTPYVIWSLFANVKTKYYITILSPVELWSRCKSLQTIYIITLANQKVFHSLKN